MENNSPRNIKANKIDIAEINFKINNLKSSLKNKKDDLKESILRSRLSMTPTGFSHQVNMQRLRKEIWGLEKQINELIVLKDDIVFNVREQQLNSEAYLSQTIAMGLF